MKIPLLEPVNRSREYQQYSKLQIDKIVMEYLFNAKSHRWLDEHVLQLDSKQSKGYMAMGILHYIGLKRAHKGVFKGLKTSEALTKLNEVGKENFQHLIDILKSYENQNNKFPYRVDSWEVVSPSVAIKTVDKSVFLQGTGIPKKIKFVFGIDSLGEGKKKDVLLCLDNNTYSAHFVIENNNNRRSRLFWKKDFLQKLQEVFTDYYKAVISERKNYGIIAPRIIFERISENKYNITLRRNSDKHSSDFSTIEQLNSDTYKQVKKSKLDSAIERRSRLAKANPVATAITVKTTAYKRNPDVIAEVLERANGKCERCNKPAPFIRASDGTPYLEVHHKKALSDMGNDTVNNSIALCPNCHRELHFGQMKSE